MNKKIFISFGLLALLAAAAVLINFDRSVEAAYLGSGLPEGTTNYTLWYDGDSWEPSGTLRNDNTNVTVTNTINANAAIITTNVTAADFLYSSDASLKDNITPLAGSLDKVRQLEGVSFNWKSNGEAEIGLIAQEVEKVVPELVVTSEETGLKSVKYGNIVALLIEAIEEQQMEIDTLKAQMAEMSN